MGRADPAQITVLALDVDGVLTDGSIFVDADGRELKRFNVRDGFGLALWRRRGFAAWIITARSSPAVEHRAKELGIARVVKGSKDKAAALAELCAAEGVDPSRVAYLGDDWPDLGAMARAGYPMAVGDAEPAVRAAAAYVTTRAGGRGAARDAVEHLLGAKGLMDGAFGLYGG